MKFLLEIDIDKLDRSRADYHLAEMLEQVAQACRELELEDGTCTTITDDDGNWVGHYMVDSSDDQGDDE